MTESHDNFIELRQLISDSVEGIITPENAARLNDLLSGSEEARRYYFELIDILVLTEHLCSEELFFLNEMQLDSSETDSYNGLLHLLAQEEKTAPAIEIIREKPPRELIHKVVCPARVA